MPQPDATLPPPLPAFRNITLRQIVIVWACLTLVLPTLIVGFYVVEKYRGRAAWRAYEADALRRGVKLEFADFIPPEIPDAENFASIPFFDAAFRAAMADRTQDVPNPFKLPEADEVEPPGFGDRTKEVPLNLAAWQKYFVEAGLLPVAGESAAADVLAALEHFAAPLAELREAGTRPHCRFPVQWEKAYGAQIPHLGLLQSAGRLHALRLSAHLALGESAAAYEDFRGGLRLNTAIAGEPSLIAGLIRIANAVVLENAVWSGLAHRQWAGPELQKIEADLAALDWLKDFHLSMGSERGAANATIEQLIEGPHRLRGVSDQHTLAAKAIGWFYPTGWLYRNQVRANQFFDELAARIDPAHRCFFPERAVPSSPEHITSKRQRIYFLFFSIMAPVLENVEKRFVQIASQTDHTRIACALERFRLARETFPEALSELTPEFLAAVPVEIVNGEPYRYRRTDDGSFLLYSIGIDLRDDGGVIDPKAGTSKQADWVWRYPVK